MLITAKRVTSLRGPPPHHCAWATQRWRAVGNSVSYLTGPGFKPLTLRCRDERPSPSFRWKRLLLNGSYLLAVAITVIDYGIPVVAYANMIDTSLREQSGSAIKFWGCWQVDNIVKQKKAKKCNF